MNKIVTWSIINNEMDYIKDVVEAHLLWADAMYFLDTGSTDGTLEYLKSQVSERVIVEEYSIKYVPQYEVEWKEMENPFPEVTVRNYALQRVEELCRPDWLIQLDGDEIFLSDTKKILLESEHHTCIGHSTINPVCKLEEHTPERRGGYTLYDPHVRIWKAGQGIKYINNPAFKGKQFHCIPVSNQAGKHLFHHPLIKFIEQPIHFHLHWMYGKKVTSFFTQKGVLNKQDIISFQNENKYSNILPKLFWDKRSEWAIK